MESNVAIKQVTPEQAIAWLNKAGYDKQRSVREWWVSYLAEEMKKGNFEQDTALMFMKHNGALELVDGQHRLNAVVKSGLSQRFVIVIRDVSDEQAVADAYYRLDQSLRRTASDQYRVLELEEKLDLTSTDLNALGASVKFLFLGFDFKASGPFGKTIHPDERLRLMMEYSDAARHYFTMKMGAPSEISAALKRASTVSVALVTYRFSINEYGLEKVDEFWRGAIFDDNVAKGDARKIVNRHFWTAGMLSSTSSHDTNVSQAYAARLIARCFNAYMKGEVLKQGKVLDQTAPILILGSPFNGK